MAIFGKRKRKVVHNFDKFDSLVKDNKLDDGIIRIYHLIKVNNRKKTGSLLEELELSQLNVPMDVYLEENFDEVNYRIRLSKRTKNGIEDMVGQVDYHIGDEQEESSVKDRMFNNFLDILTENMKNQLAGKNGDAFDKALKEAYIKKITEDPEQVMSRSLDMADRIYSRAPQPQIAETDPLTMLLTQLVAPIVGSVINQRLGGNLGQLGQASEPVRLPGSQLAGYASKNQLDQDKIKSSSLLPASGGTETIAAEPIKDYQRAFEIVFLEPLAKMQAPYDDIAEKIYMMMGYCMTIPDDQLHPAVLDISLGMKNGDEALAMSGFQKLCEYLKFDEAKSTGIARILYELDKISREKFKEDNEEEKKIVPPISSDQQGSEEETNKLPDE